MDKLIITFLASKLRQNSNRTDSTTGEDLGTDFKVTLQFSIIRNRKARKLLVMAVFLALQRAMY